MNNMNIEDVLNTCEGLCMTADTDNITMHPLQYDKETIKLSRILDTIYRIIHSHRRTSCYYIHDDWRKEAKKINKKLIKMGYISKFDIKR